MPAGLKPGDAAAADGAAAAAGAPAARPLSMPASAESSKDAGKLELENQSLKRRLVQYAATLEKLTGHARREIDASVRARDDALAAAADTAVLREQVVDLKASLRVLQLRRDAGEDALAARDARVAELEQAAADVGIDQADRLREREDAKRIADELASTSQSVTLERSARLSEQERSVRLETELNQMRAKLATLQDADNGIKDAQTARQLSDVRYKDAETKLADIVKKELAARSERDLYAKKAAESDDAAAKLRSQLASALTKVNGLEKAHMDTSTELGSRAISAEKKASTAAESISALRAERDHVKAQLADTKAAFEEASVAAAQVEAQREAVDERDVLKSKMVNVEDELRQSNELLTRAAIDALGDKQRIRKLEDVVLKMRDAAATDRKERQARDSKIALFTTTLQAAEKELDGLRNTKRTLAEQLHKYQVQIHEQDNTMRFKNRELEQLGAVRADREAKSLQLALDLSNSKNSLAKKESDFVNLSTAYDEVRLQLRNTSTDLESKDLQVTSLQRDLTTSADRLAELEKEAERGRATKAELDTTTRQLHDTNAKLSAKVDLLSTMSRSFTTLKTDAADAQREKKRLSEMLAEVSADLKNANQELNILRGLRKDQEMLANRINEIRESSARELESLRHTQTEQAERLAKNTIEGYQRKLEENQASTRADIAASVTTQLRDDLMPQLLNVVDRKAKRMVTSLAKHVESFTFEIGADTEAFEQKQLPSSSGAAETHSTPARYTEQIETLMQRETGQAVGAPESPSMSRSIPTSFPRADDVFGTESREAIDLSSSPLSGDIYGTLQTDADGIEIVDATQASDPEAEGVTLTDLFAAISGDKHPSEFTEGIIVMDDEVAGADDGEDIVDKEEHAEQEDEPEPSAVPVRLHEQQEVPATVSEIIAEESEPVAPVSEPVEAEATPLAGVEEPESLDRSFAVPEAAEPSSEPAEDAEEASPEDGVLLAEHPEAAADDQVEEDFEVTAGGEEDAGDLDKPSDADAVDPSSQERSFTPAAIPQSQDELSEEPEPAKIVDGIEDTIAVGPDPTASREVLPAVDTAEADVPAPILEDTPVLAEEVAVEEEGESIEPTPVDAQPEPEEASQEEQPNVDGEEAADEPQPTAEATSVPIASEPKMTEEMAEDPVTHDAEPAEVVDTTTEEAATRALPSAVVEDTYPVLGAEPEPTLDTSVEAPVEESLTRSLPVAEDADEAEEPDAIDTQAVEESPAEVEETSDVNAVEGEAEESPSLPFGDDAGVKAAEEAEVAAQDEGYDATQAGSTEVQESVEAPADTEEATRDLPTSGFAGVHVAEQADSEAQVVDEGITDDVGGVEASRDLPQMATTEEVETVEGSGADVPEAEAVGEPAVEAPEAETVEEPAVEAPKAETVEEPAAEAPEAETVEEPAAEAPEAETVEEPAAEAPEAETVEEPAVEAPEAETVEEPAVEVTEVEAATDSKEVSEDIAVETTRSLDATPTAAEAGDEEEKHAPLDLSAEVPVLAEEARALPATEPVVSMEATEEAAIEATVEEPRAQSTTVQQMVQADEALEGSTEVVEGDEVPTFSDDTREMDVTEPEVTTGEVVEVVQEASDAQAAEEAELEALVDDGHPAHPAEVQEAVGEPVDVEATRDFPQEATAIEETEEQVTETQADAEATAIDSSNIEDTGDLGVDAEGTRELPVPAAEADTTMEETTAVGKAESAPIVDVADETGAGAPIVEAAEDASAEVSETVDAIESRGFPVVETEADVSAVGVTEDASAEKNATVDEMESRGFPIVEADLAAEELPQQEEPADEDAPAEDAEVPGEVEGQQPTAEATEAVDAEAAAEGEYVEEAEHEAAVDESLPVSTAEVVDEAGVEEAVSSREVDVAQLGVVSEEAIPTGYEEPIEEATPYVEAEADKDDSIEEAVPYKAPAVAAAVEIDEAGDEKVVNGTGEGEEFVDADSGESSEFRTGLVDVAGNGGATTREASEAVSEPVVEQDGSATLEDYATGETSEPTPELAAEAQEAGAEEESGAVEAVAQDRGIGDLLQQATGQAVLEEPEMAAENAGGASALAQGLAGMMAGGTDTSGATSGLAGMMSGDGSTSGAVSGLASMMSGDSGASGATSGLASMMPGGVESAGAAVKAMEMLPEGMATTMLKSGVADNLPTSVKAGLATTAVKESLTGGLPEGVSPALMGASVVQQTTLGGTGGSGGVAGALGNLVPGFGGDDAEKE